MAGVCVHFKWCMARGGGGVTRQRWRGRCGRACGWLWSSSSAPSTCPPSLEAPSACQVRNPLPCPVDAT